MGYARSQVVAAPDGRVYEVAASPRGDLLAGVPESGPMSWLSTTPGVLGLLSLVINLAVFRGRWRVVVREPARAQLVGQRTTLRRFDLRRRDVESTMTALARSIAEGQEPSRLTAPDLS